MKAPYVKADETEQDPEYHETRGTLWEIRGDVYKRQQEGYPKGAYVSADSPYRNFFSFNDPNAWPYNTSYDGWWAHDTLDVYKRQLLNSYRDSLIKMQ